MHTLFALAEHHLETLSTPFGTILIDLVTFMEEEWDLLLSSIETGVLPDFDGNAHIQVYIQVNHIIILMGGEALLNWEKPYFLANPERAAELRALGPVKDSPGWLKMIWPNLKEYTGVISGTYAGILPKVLFEFIQLLVCILFGSLCRRSDILVQM